MKNSALRLFAFSLSLALIFSCTACKKSNSSGDESLTDSFVDIIYDNEESGSTDSTDSSSKIDANHGSSVALDTKNLEKDSNPQKELQKQLKDSAKGKTLKILSTWGEDGLMNQCYRSMFKALCGGSLEIIRCADWSGMQQKLAQMHAANNAPDLYEVTNQDYPSVVYRGIIEPLSDHIDFNNGVYSDADRKLLNELKFNGKVYFWPTFKEPNGARTGLWVNDSIFEQFGIPENQRPKALVKANNWTWDTMYDLIKKTTDKAKGIYGLATPENSSFPYGMAATTGEDLIKYTNNGIISNFTSANITRAMNMFKKMSDANYCIIQKAADTFQNGKAAMMYGVAYNVSNKKINAMAQDGTAYIVPLARDPKQSNYNVFATVDGLAVPSGSKNKGIAMNFIKMLRASDHYSKQVAEIYYKQNKFTTQARQYSEDCVNKYNMVSVTSLGIKEILGTTWEAWGQNFLQSNATWETRGAEYSPKIQSILDKLG